MKEIIITSSVLILCIMLMRVLFKGKISGRLQYALWLLVALRLIIPSSAQIHMAVGSIEQFRIMDLVEALEERFGDVTERLEEPVQFTISLDSTLAGQTAEFMLGEDLDLPDTADGPTSVFLAGRIGHSWLDILRGTWIGGMVIVAVWMIITNVIFSRKLRRRRKEFALPEELMYLCDRKQRGSDGCEHGKKGCKVRLYTTDYITSSCLYGLPGREAIYLTPDIAEDQKKLRHVVTHEMCHRKHGDSFWSILRSALICVYWMNPLVWVAAFLSKRDCELACDERALLILGEEERIPYGETLLSIITGKSRLSDIVCTATTMHGSGKSVKERIRFIAEKPRVLGAAVVAVLLLIMVVSVMVFTKQPMFSGHTWEGEITLYAGDMQIRLPETIAGISGYDTIQDSDDIVIYQVCSGQEVGRFRVLSYEDAVALAEAGRQIVPVGNYGLNDSLRSYMRALRAYAPMHSTTVFTPNIEHEYTESGEDEGDTNDNPMLSSDWEVVPLEEAREYLPNEQITGENISEADSVTRHEYTSGDPLPKNQDMPVDSVAGDGYIPANEQSQGMIAHEEIFNPEAVDHTSGVPGTDINDDTTYMIDDSSEVNPAAAEESTDYLPNEQITTTVTTPDEQGVKTASDKQDASEESVYDKCYVYVKADYAELEEQYREEMEHINNELEKTAGHVIVVSINQELREEMFRMLAENRTEYLGDASRTGALVSALPQTDGLRYQSITLHTLETQPETALSLEVRYKMTTQNMSDQDADILFFNAAMLFATIRNLDECSFILDKNGISEDYRADYLEDEDTQPVEQYTYSTLTYSRTDLEEAVGTLWSDEAAQSDEGYFAWLEDLYVRIADYL